jgi:hypothetical protein
MSGFRADFTADWISEKSLMKIIQASLLIALALSVVGCNSLPKSLSSDVASDVSQAAEQSDAPHVRVEFHEPGKQPQLALLPLPVDGHLFVSEALKEAKVRKHLSRFHAEVYRQSATGYQRMAVKMNSGHRDVVSQYDYALRSGDRLVITPDNSDIFEDMFGSVSGPLKWF